MKKSKIKPIEFLKDVEGILELVNKIDNINPENTDLSKLNKILLKKEKQIKNKYKHLDSEK
jgi:hypothetical protein|tara:strand:- start:40 stop:222 length:183 start_codon:yes stop_codon:yes gene_type:complete